ncbi:CLUMA_CG007558, isoform A [Clunio marinus]|uniref:CLUMA_CG007558, isoform A n=1 Tax=Clunio marinus TaxID=568069 RepID=A0A1J1I2N9_9DIPT|nr:CLUMA_CG007558, isoform A [Clunio marinus]
MKCLVLSLLLFIDVSLASPLPHHDGILEEIKQNIVIEDPKHRWSMVPDAEGRMHLIDLNPYEMPVEPLFNAAADIRFILHTRSNPTAGQVIQLENLASLQNSNFNPAHETRITIHGWLGTAGSTVHVNTRPQYLEVDNFNLVTVDWSVGASSINYITARNRVDDAAAVVARFIDFCHLHGFIQFPRVHIIGHSLGGQMAGVAGKRVSRGRVQVITALDPAGPLFSLNDPDRRVAPTDGVYVEVIVTNGGVLGFMDPIGQANFYPNFGVAQPGCGSDASGQCAHERVNAFFAESIRTVFTGRQCASFAEIGNNQCTPTGVTSRMGGAFGSVGASGIFHLTTNANAPFSMG